MVCGPDNITLNPKKSKIMHIGKQNHRRPFFIVEENGSMNRLNTTESEKDLGVIVCASGSWTNQVNFTASKGNRALGMMRRTFRRWTTELAKLVYQTRICFVSIES